MKTKKIYGQEGTFKQVLLSDVKLNDVFFNSMNKPARLKSFQGVESNGFRTATIAWTCGRKFEDGRVVHGIWEFDKVWILIKEI